MRIISTDSQWIFVACKEVPEGSRKEVVFVSEEVFDLVKSFVEVTGIKADKDYWEEDRHSKLVRLLTSMLNPSLNRRDISNSLSALGL